MVVHVTEAPWRCVAQSLPGPQRILPRTPPPTSPLPRGLTCPFPGASVPRADLRSHSSMAQRSDFLELDCQLTRDGVVVVSHDENLSRQSGVNRDVSSLNFEVGLALAPLLYPESHHASTRAFW